MKVSLVGAGPGDPELLTLKGQKLLREADAIIYDALASPELLRLARPDAKIIYVGKIADKHALPQAEINALLVDCARQYGNVVRLKGGDPYIFGRGGEEGEYLDAHGIPFEVVPGISSAIAAPAYAGIPITHRGYTSALTIVTGHENPQKNESAINWQALASSGATLVFVMGMKNLTCICKNLVDAGMSPDTPAAIVYRGTTPMQRSLFAPLAKLASASEDQGFTNPSVIVVGRVVELHEKLDWLIRKPLFSRRIIVTRSREQASGMAATLASAGADVLEFPTIAIKALENYAAADTAIDNLHAYAWLIFTSVNGVRFFWERLALKGLDSRALCSCKVAAIGPATAEALLQKGIRADLVPPAYVAESVAQALIGKAGVKIQGMRILLARAREARMVLPDALAQAGALVDVAPLYQAVPANGNTPELSGLIRNGLIDCISFASSSTARNFLELVPPAILLGQPNTVLAAIGPITAKTLEEHGLKPEIIPAEYTIPALCEAIEKFYASKAQER